VLKATEPDETLAVLAWAADGRLLTCNPSAQRLLGVVGQNPHGGHLDELLGVGETRRLMEDMGEVGTLSSPQTWSLPSRKTPPLVRQTLALRGPTGELHYLCLFGEEAGWFAFDLDAKAHYACALSGRIAHDLGNMLVPVLGNVALLEGELPSGHPLGHRLEAIRESVGAARTFMQRLAVLDPERKPSLHASSLSSLVRRVRPGLEKSLRAGVRLWIDEPPALDGVRIDRRQIEHVLHELVWNAQDAMPSGGVVTVTLDMADGPQQRRWVRLTVRDTGRGMDPALLKHAFEPFVTTKMPGSGAGLGLAGVATIVQQHGGRAHADSKIGAGTTITVLLPSTGEPEPDADPVTPSPDVAPVPARMSATVLLVEDNAMVRRSIEATLRGMGYAVLAVESGLRCLETVRARTGPIDLVMTDVIMPEMGGKELIDRVREVRPGIPALFMSGYDRATLAGRKEPVAFEHFLQKPFDSDDLADAVRKAIASSALGSSAKSTLG
jgi:two-component system cell cycle sensor histidine kinase/response regulator CckA